MRDELWNQIDKIHGWLQRNEGEILAKYASPDGINVELGTWMGKSTACIASVSKGKFYTIDHYVGSYGHEKEPNLPLISAITTRKNLAKLRLASRVKILAGNLRQFAFDWQEPIDFIFIDADHQYGSVKSDINLWLPHVKPHGIISFHDYDSWPGVTQAVDEAVKDGKFEAIEQGGSVLITKKL